jgi:nicotinamidase/pyrazinamidase
MLQVFISYYHEHKSFADRVADKLKLRGYNPWIAEDSLLLSMGWKRTIDEAIQGSIAVIVIMNERAKASEYVTYEWAYAMGRDKPVICILTENVKLHPKLNDLQVGTFVAAVNEQYNWDLLLRSLDWLKTMVPVTDAPPPAIATTSGHGVEASHAGVDGDIGNLRDGDVFVVVDVQRDFCKGGLIEVSGAEALIPRLNEAIKAADSRGMQIVFTRDWHPKNHSSFTPQGGEWPPHCVMDTPGADWHPALVRPEGSVVVNIGEERTRAGYSPYEQSKMDAIINRQGVKKVYVAGIALEYCVLATCLETRLRKKTVVACEKLICAATVELRQKSWKKMEEAGVERSDKESPIKFRWPGSSDGSNGEPVDDVNSDAVRESRPNDRPLAVKIKKRPKVGRSPPSLKKKPKSTARAPKKKPRAK